MKLQRYMLFIIISVVFWLVIYQLHSISNFRRFLAMKLEMKPLTGHPSVLNEEIMNHSFSTGIYNTSTTIVVSTCRSGSSFLGEILKSYPTTFYHFEPLHVMGDRYEGGRIRFPPQTDIALDILKNLIQCKFNVLNRFHEWPGKYLRFSVVKFNHIRKLCKNAQFLSECCRLNPFKVIKLIRLPLHLLEKLLSDESMNIKVIFLVRDPRGVIQSRKSVKWCSQSKKCIQPSYLCADMESDYLAAKRFTRVYNSAFTIVRYEELSLDPYITTKRLFKFLGLQFHHEVLNYLDTHTKLIKGAKNNPYSTYRNSSSAPFSWRELLPYQEVAVIQDQCKTAMEQWGYFKALNATHQRTFNSVNPAFNLSQFT